MISIEYIDNGYMRVRPLSDPRAVALLMNGIRKTYDKSNKCYVLKSNQINELINVFGFDIEFLNTPDTIGKPKEITNNIYDEKYSQIDGFDGIKVVLYPFQVVGANYAYYNKRVLIADVMGLGKTIQALAAMVKIKNNGNLRRAIVICPASVKYQWLGEVNNKSNLSTYVIERFSNYKGKTQEEREKNFLEEFENNLDKDVIILNYESLLNDTIMNAIINSGYNIVVIDECHSVKNKAAKRSQRVYQLTRNSEYVIGLSGTPLENRPPELFGVFSAIDHTLFPNFTSFAKMYIKYYKYGIISGYKNLEHLRNKIYPYIIRRTLNDVKLQLPDKVITTKEIEMTEKQAELHAKIYDEIMTDFERLEEVRSKYTNIDEDNPPEPIKNIKASIMAKFSFLMEICDDVRLLQLSDSKMAQRYAIQDSKSPKLEALLEIVEQIIEQGSKVVIFTQFERMLDIIKNEIESKFKIKTAYISGSVKPSDRQKEVEKFKNNNDCNVMLLTDAGNYGLNLQNANYLVMYEPPLKPSVYDQRIGRIVRIGSEHRTAFIINLVMRGGWDQKVFDILEKKRQYTTQLIEKDVDDINSANKTADSVNISDLKKIVQKHMKNKK